MASSPPPIHNIALLGASGRLGQPLLPALLAAGFKVTVLVRASSKSTANSYPPSTTITHISDDFTTSELLSAFQNQDAIIIALAHAANAAHHRKIIDCAAQAGVRHVIPNHWSSNAELPVIRALSERSEALDADVDWLREKYGTDAKIGWTAVVTGIFFDLALPVGLLGFDLKERTVEIWDDGEARFSPSTNNDICKATIAVLKNPEKVRNQYVYTSSFEVSQNELLAVVERVSGQKWTVKHTTREEKVKGAEETVKSGVQGMQWLRAQGILAAGALFGGKEYQADFEGSGRSSNELLGLKGESVEHAVRRFVG